MHSPTLPLALALPLTFAATAVGQIRLETHPFTPLVALPSLASGGDHLVGGDFLATPQAPSLLPILENDRTFPSGTLATDHWNGVAIVGFDVARSTRVQGIWHGCQWTWDATPFSGGPGPRTAWAMCAEPYGNRVVLFGGADTNGAPLGDTWIWDPDAYSWTAWTGSPSPSPRAGHAMGGGFLFGGEGPGGQLLGDTWAWNWTSMEWVRMPIPGPGPRAYSAHCGALEMGISELSLYGGRDATGQSTEYWRLSGRDHRWVQVTSTITPGPVTDGVLTSRGYLYRPSSAEVWYHDGGDWSVATLGGTLPARAGHALFQGSRSLIAFGGEANGTVLGDTWEFRGDGWHERSPSVMPPARSHAAVASRAFLSPMVYGGRDANGQPLDDLWEWTGTDWRQWTSLGGPALEGATLFEAGDLVLHGGRGSGGVTGDTWIGTLTTPRTVQWALYQGASPPAREGALRSESGYVHGGRDPAGVVLDDTWVWANGAWSPSVSSGQPRWRGAGDVAGPYPLVVAGGFDGQNQRLRSVMGFDGSTWEPCEDLPVAVADAQTTLSNDYPMVVGGTTDQGPTGEATWLVEQEFRSCSIGAPCPNQGVGLQNPQLTVDASNNQIDFGLSDSFGFAGLGFVVLSTSPDSCAGMPVVLRPYGFPGGCRLTVCSNWMLAAVFGRFPSVRFPAVLPPGSSYWGTEVYAQAVLLGTDDNGRPRNAVSAELAIVLGPF